MMSTTARRAAIVIPAYQPTSTLADLVAGLSADGRVIIVVDDGSSKECAPIFARVAACANVTVISHAVNLGKGQALKTAFNHVLLHAPAEAVGVVTADADGQHLAADVRRILERLEQSPSALVLGTRRFEGRVPLRNRLGNVITRGVFRLLIGRHVSDTQTGLRGIPRTFLGELLQLEAGRYEFELEMLVRACCPPDGVVLDPFCGSGTTVVASARLGRRWIGIDVNPHAARIARQRLTNVEVVSAHEHATADTRA